MPRRNQIAVAAFALVCCLAATGCTSRPAVHNHPPAVQRTPITGRDRANYDRVVAAYVGALASDDATLAAKLYDGPLDFQLSRRSVLGRYASIPAAKFTVLSVNGETLVGGGHLGPKPAGWLATATVEVVAPGRRETFKVDFGGTAAGRILVQSAGAEPAAR